MNLYLVGSFSLIVMGVYAPVFARLYELASLIHVVQKYKKIKYTYYIFLCMMVFLIFLLYHYDKFFVALRDIMYLVRTPVLIFSVYFLCIEELFNKQKILIIVLKLWLFYYFILLTDIFIYVVFSIGPYFSYGGGTFRTFGFADPNSLVVFIYLAITVALFYLRSFNITTNNKRFIAILLLMSFLVFFFTGSRGGLLGLCVVIFVELTIRGLKTMLSLKINRNILIYCSLALFVVLLQSALLLSQGFDLVSYWRFNDDTGGSNRLGRWINAFRLIQSSEYSLFFGWPMTSDELAEYLGGWPHNSYVKLILNYGFIIFTFFTFLLMRVLYFVRNDSLARALIIFLMVTCMTNDFITSPIPGIYMGVALAISSLREKSQKKKDSI